MSLDLIKCQISPPKITCGSIKCYRHIHFTAFTSYPQKLPFILAQISAIPPQEPSMQVMPESLFKRMAGDRTADLQNKYQKNVTEEFTVFTQRTEHMPDSRCRHSTSLTVEWFFKMPSRTFLLLQNPSSPWAYRNTLVKSKATICQILNSFLQSW